MESVDYEGLSTGENGVLLAWVVGCIWRYGQSIISPTIYFLFSHLQKHG